MIKKIALKWETSNWVAYQDTATPHQIATTLTNLSEYASEAYNAAREDGFIELIIEPIVERMRIEADSAYLNARTPYEENEEARRGYRDLAEICTQFSTLSGLKPEILLDFERAAAAFELDNPSGRASDLTPIPKPDRGSLPTPFVNEIDIVDLFKDL